jgi:NodT family efflux transporter outer membrane factor (OMF) lipoprotein
MDGYPLPRIFSRSPGRAPGLAVRLRRLAALSVALVGIVSAGGCRTSLPQWWRNGFKVGPNYSVPEAPVAAQWIDVAEGKVPCEPAGDGAWWTVFHDPALDVLIETAQRQNLDLRSAGTRILEARAQRGIAVANLLPQRQSALGALAQGQLSKNIALPLPTTVSIWASGFNASWEADFWGRYRRAIESADADVGAAVEGYRDALVMLLSEVATSYVQMRTFEERLNYARRNVEVQTGSLGLAEQRFNNGVANELDVRQASSNLAQTQALIPPLEAGRRQAANRLAILLGVPVYDLAKQFTPTGIPHPPLTVATGIPADLIRRRPDIRQAERQVASQSAQIGIAESDWYPRLSLNGFVGYASNDLKDLFSSKSFTGFIIPNFQWNVLNYGRIANNVRVEDAQFQRAVLQYQQTVLVAGREVEDALIGYLTSQQQAASLAISVREAERSVELVILQYKGGIVDFNRVFTVQQQLVVQQDQLAAARGSVSQNLVEVYRALGGGWQVFDQTGPCAGTCVVSDAKAGSAPVAGSPTVATPAAGGPSADSPAADGPAAGKPAEEIRHGFAPPERVPTPPAAGQGPQF